MSDTITVTPKERQWLLERAAQILASELKATAKEMSECVSPSKAAGMLDVNSKTLDGLKIPKRVLIPNKVVRYRKADLESYLDSIRE